jgi:protein-S-isoprenylcysteine O-methyltransferase Ste14
MLPPALGFFDLSQSAIWRVSSLFAALLQALFVLTFRARRRAVTDIPIPTWARVAHGLQMLIAIFLLAIALGISVELAAGPFVMSITACLLVSAVAYLAQLEVMLRGHVKMKKRK